MALKKRILFVTTIEFRPPFNGGTSYTNCIYESLTSLYDVEVVILQQQRKFRLEWVHGLVAVTKALITSVPLNVIYHSGCSRKSVHDLGDYHHIVIDHLESILWAVDTGYPYFLIAHNIESKLANDKLQNSFIRCIFNLKRRLEKYEVKVFTAAAGVICISFSEQELIKKVNDRTVQLLPAFNSVEYHCLASNIPRFGFLGPASWNPNLRTVRMLTNKVFPYIDQRFEFVLAGSGWDSQEIKSPKEFRQLGFVKDISEFWGSIDVLIAPTQHGAGVNIKICEALHYGVPVITNKESALAIFGEKPAPPNVLVAESPDDLISLMNTFKIPVIKKPSLEFTKVHMQSVLCGFLENLR